MGDFFLRSICGVQLMVPIHRTLAWISTSVNYQFSWVCMQETFSEVRACNKRLQKIQPLILYRKTDLLEGGQRSKNRTTNPYWVFTLRWCDDLNFHRARCQSCYFFLQWWQFQFWKQEKIPLINNLLSSAYRFLSYQSVCDLLSLKRQINIAIFETWRAAWSKQKVIEF